MDVFCIPVLLTFCLFHIVSNTKLSAESPIFKKSLFMINCVFFAKTKKILRALT